MSDYLHLDESARWRRQQLLDEAKKRRLIAQLPATPVRTSLPLSRVVRHQLAHVLFALASWLSPDVGTPARTFELARARRRNGTV